MLDRASPRPWQNPNARKKFIQRVMKINASSKSLVERLCDFKIYATSVLSFIGSVCAPDNATFKAQNLALHCTTAGQYKATTSSLLQVSSICGLGPDLVGIHSIRFPLFFALYPAWERDFFSFHDL